MDTAAAKTAVENIRKELDNSKGTHIWQDYVSALRLVSRWARPASPGGCPDRGCGSGKMNSPRKGKALFFLTNPGKQRP